MCWQVCCISGTLRSILMTALTNIFDHQSGGKRHLWVIQRVMFSENDLQLNQAEAAVIIPSTTQENCQIYVMTFWKKKNIVYHFIISSKSYMTQKLTQFFIDWSSLNKCSCPSDNIVWNLLSGALIHLWCALNVFAVIKPIKVVWKTFSSVLIRAH